MSQEKDSIQARIERMQKKMNNVISSISDHPKYRKKYLTQYQKDYKFQSDDNYSEREDSIHRYKAEKPKSQIVLPQQTYQQQPSKFKYKKVFNSNRGLNNFNSDLRTNTENAYYDPYEQNKMSLSQHVEEQREMSEGNWDDLDYYQTPGRQNQYYTFDEKKYQRIKNQNGLSIQEADSQIVTGVEHKLPVVSPRYVDNFHNVTKSHLPSIFHVDEQDLSKNNSFDLKNKLKDLKYCLSCEKEENKSVKSDKKERRRQLSEKIRAGISYTSMEEQTKNKKVWFAKQHEDIAIKEDIFGDIMKRLDNSKGRLNSDIQSQLHTEEQVTPEPLAIQIQVKGQQQTVHSEQRKRGGHHRSQQQREDEIQQGLTGQNPDDEITGKELEGNMETQRTEDSELQKKPEMKAYFPRETVPEDEIQKQIVDKLFLRFLKDKNHTNREEERNKERIQAEYDQQLSKELLEDTPTSLLKEKYNLDANQPLFSEQRGSQKSNKAGTDQNRSHHREDTFGEQQPENGQVRKSSNTSRGQSVEKKYQANRPNRVSTENDDQQNQVQQHKEQRKRGGHHKSNQQDVPNRNSTDLEIHRENTAESLQIGKKESILRKKQNTGDSQLKSAKLSNIDVFGNNNAVSQRLSQLQQDAQYLPMGKVNTVKSQVYGTESEASKSVSKKSQQSIQSFADSNLRKMNQTKLDYYTSAEFKQSDVHDIITPLEENTPIIVTDRTMTPVEFSNKMRTQQSLQQSQQQSQKKMSSLDRQKNQNTPSRTSVENVSVYVDSNDIRRQTLPQNQAEYSPIQLPGFKSQINMDRDRQEKEVHAVSKSSTLADKFRHPPQQQQQQQQMMERSNGFERIVDPVHSNMNKSRSNSTHKIEQDEHLQSVYDEFRASINSGPKDNQQSVQSIQNQQPKQYRDLSKSAISEDKHINQVYEEFRRSMNSGPPKSDNQQSTISTINSVSPKHSMQPNIPKKQFTSNNFNESGNSIQQNMNYGRNTVTKTMNNSQKQSIAKSQGFASNNFSESGNVTDEDFIGIHQVGVTNFHGKNYMEPQNVIEEEADQFNSANNSKNPSSVQKPKVQQPQMRVSSQQPEQQLTDRHSRSSSNHSAKVNVVLKSQENPNYETIHQIPNALTTQDIEGQTMSGLYNKQDFRHVGEDSQRVAYIKNNSQTSKDGRPLTQNFESEAQRLSLQISNSLKEKMNDSQGKNKYKNFSEQQIQNQNQLGLDQIVSSEVRKVMTELSQHLDLSQNFKKNK